MSVRTSFIGEIRHEMSMTRKMLERVPMDQKDWKPHEKSMSIGRLATHIAENIHWISVIKSVDEFDFAATPLKANVAGSSEELLSIFDKNLEQAVTDLNEMSDDDLDKTWTVRRGDHVLSTIPKKVAIRGWAISHLIHHRGQLSVMLRLLDVAVPGMYGPSADER